MTSSLDPSTRKYGTLGLTVLCAAALTGYGLVAWSIWQLDWMPTELLAKCGIAAAVFPGAGLALGYAFTARKPRPVRIFALSAGAAIGSVCLLLAAVGYIWFSMSANL
ncbi:hypothetical protein ABT158_35985 [Nonomuraea sp. NPDC001636]|uniref:hypothetical protein n=1 Tax=Nonomuraea sp. NPDC001636 TaxID=3154391 RepID=UPI003333E564